MRIVRTATRRPVNKSVNTSKTNINVGPESRDISKIHVLNSNLGNSSIISQQVHDYDGKLVSDIVISTNASKIDVSNIFPDLKEILKKNESHLLYKTGMQALELIEKNIGDQANYDSTNNFRAETILYLIYQKLKEMNEIDSGLIDIIIEGLSDIVTSGSCPQGRSTRLYQIYVSLE